MGNCGSYCSSHKEHERHYFTEKPFVKIVEEEASPENIHETSFESQRADEMEETEVEKLKVN